MSDEPKEAEKKMEKQIWMCGDNWLKVFELVPIGQLGLGIALVSRAFDFFVDEHFKMRKWTLDSILIRCKFAEDGQKEMQTFNSRDELVPIQKVPLPNKVVGFKCIRCRYIDQNVVDFLSQFRHLFAAFGANLLIINTDEPILEWVMRIWPMLKGNICQFRANNHGELHKFIPLLINNCPSLHLVSSGNVFPIFPADDSANASVGQVLAKWLFSPRSDGVPKELWCSLKPFERLSAINDLKTAFLNASSRAYFIIFIRNCGYYSGGGAPVVSPFELINNLTGERLTFKMLNRKHAMLKRYPIAQDEQKWANWENNMMVMSEKNVIWIEDEFDKSRKKAN